MFRESPFRSDARGGLRFLALAILTVRGSPYDRAHIHIHDQEACIMPPNLSSTTLEQEQLSPPEPPTRRVRVRAQFERSPENLASEALEAAGGDISRVPAELRGIAQRLLGDLARANRKHDKVKAGRAPAEIAVFGKRPRTVRFYIAPPSRRQDGAASATCGRRARRRARSRDRRERRHIARRTSSADPPDGPSDGPGFPRRRRPLRAKWGAA
jgi:hypothetical protein